MFNSNKEKEMPVVTLPPNYKPSKKEEYMNEMQLEYFRQKLLSWKSELMKSSETTLQNLKETNLNEADANDRASNETDQFMELRTRDRARKLIKKIDQALERIENGTYGYCEETGEPIGLGRLEARPVTTLSIEAQERHERKEQTFAEE
jgi:DnaK suppressor protein